MYQLGYYLTGALGFAGVAISLMWVLHIILYLLPKIPVHPLLNDMFRDLDAAFPLFGVTFFALFCGYMMVVAIKGNFMLVRRVKESYISQMLLANRGLGISMT